MEQRAPHPIQQCIDRFSPVTFANERSLALLAAAIVPSEPEQIVSAIARARTHEVSEEAMYEVVLQSYLFLGFPRMLAAIEVFSREQKTAHKRIATEPMTPDSLGQWQERGSALCQRIYGSVFEKLRDRVCGMSPEIFEWMIVEGYGKVLSRPGLSSVEREVCIVATLAMDDREQQLYAHLRGARNVGAPDELLTSMLDDIREAAPGHAAAYRFLRELT